MMNGGRNKFPFTASQWQELEHQALVYKYMIAGMPVPPDLLYTIRRSLDSSMASKLILHQPQHIGWNCFQVGFGKKIDPEPGRCRRTDGKKWRCSKEAYPDSKYCERHMHRGRNRSRKPVEVMSTAIATATSSSSTNTSTRPSPPTAIPISSINKSITQLSPPSPPTPLPSLHAHNHPCYNPSTAALHHPFLYPHNSSSSRPPGFGLSSHENTTNFLLDSGPFAHAGKDYRSSYEQGMKEEVDEHAFFSEVSGNMRSTSGSSGDDTFQLGSSLTMEPIQGQMKDRNFSGSQSGYPYLQLQSLSDSSRQQYQRQDHQHCYSLGSGEYKSDVFSAGKIIDSNEDQQQPKKVMHHFFDEWPPKDKDSWLDSEDKFSSHVPLSQTHLSISIPTSSHDFFMSQNEK